MRRHPVRSALVVLALLLVLIPGVIFALLQTETGRNALAAYLEDALSTPGEFEVEIGRLDGWLPAEIRIDRIDVADGEGVWLSIQDIAIDWSPSKLFLARLQIDDARAREIAIARQPAPAGTQEVGASVSIPPLEITLGQAAIDELRIAEPVLGEAASLGLSASASVRQDSARARLDIARADGKAGRANAILDWNAATGSLDLQAELSEPAGGLLARLLDLPGRPPLELTVSGDGPASGWRGQMDLDAGPLLTFLSSLSIAIGEDFRLGMEGRAEPGSDLGPDAMALLGPRTDFSLELQRTGGSSDWALTVDGLASAAIRAKGKAKFNLAAATIDGTLDVETVDGGRVAPLFAPVTLGAAVAGIRFTGPLTHPAIELDAKLDRIAVAGYAAGSIDLRARLRPDGPLDAEGTAVAIEGEAGLVGFKSPVSELNRLLGDNPRVEIQDVLLRRFTQLQIGKAAVTGDKADLWLAGEIALDDGVLATRGQLTIGDLAPLSATAGRALGGRLQSEFTLARTTDGAIDLTLDGSLHDGRLDLPLVESLLGQDARFEGRGRRSAEGNLTLSDLAVTGSGVTMKGGLSLPAAADTMKADYDIAISDLAALGIADPAQAGGSVKILGRASGPLADPAVEGTLSLAGAAVGGIPVRTMEAQYSAAKTATAPHGSIRLKAANDLFPDLTGQTGFALAGSRLNLSGLRLAARGTSVDGALAVPLDGGAVAGTLRVRSPDLGKWSTVAGSDISGGMEATVGLSAAKGRQDATLAATISNFALADALTLRQLKVDARIVDILGVPRLKVSLTGDRAQAGPAQIAEISLKLDGTEKDIGYRAKASGMVGDRALRLDANGKLRQDGEKRTLTLAGLTGEAGGVPMRLRKPVVLAIGPVIDSGDIDLALGEGAVLGRYRQGNGTVTMRLEGRAIPLVSVWPAAPSQLGKAVIEAQASLDGPVGRPEGQFSLSVTGVAAGETDETPEGLTLAAQGQLRDGRLTATSRIDKLAGVTSLMDVSMPARLSLAPAGFSIDETASLTGRLTYAGPVAPSWALMGLDRHRLEGKGDVAVELSGTLRDPRISGFAKLTEGRYENLDTGTILSEIRFSARPSKSSVVIEEAVAKDGGDGEITITGAIEFGGSDLIAMNIEAHLRKARLVRRDELTAVASGDIALRGGMATRQISGRLDVEEAEIRLTGGLPPGTVEIKVEETGTAPAGALKAPAPPRPSKTSLDLAISMPRRVFVRGRGLDSEWGGQLKVTGTTSSPLVQGELHPLRGRYDFAGKVFTLRKGSIGFAGKSEIDPDLDLSAEHKITELTAIIHVTGTAKRPVVGLESVPELPQDEILARILFNKSTGRLTAGEALQLAQALGTLTGASDGGGIMDFARGMLNLDVLRIEGGGDESKGGAEAGKYITDRIYIGVGGDANGEAGVTVEIEILPSLKLDSDVGNNEKSQMGLKWKRDY